jgi:aerobic-type carbon monoxide dehydrogenase small subunit (CoxS/CutS family)
VIRIEATVNGDSVSAEVEGRTLLSDFIRHELGLTGTHVGCEHGVCGACTVIVDGGPARSCLMLAAQADGKEITTVEGVGADGDLSDVQRALGEENGLQCGFCTPGIVMSMTAALSRDDLDEDEMMEMLGGHICRCTGYQGIRSAAEGLLGRRQGRVE